MKNVLSTNHAMATSKINYLGNLRTECEHTRSNTTIITDAPVDNNGKGEAFSPTDLVATALGSCMITLMGIRAEKHGFELAGAKAEITKEMGTQPRRITGITVILNISGPYTEKEKAILEVAALNCPVAKSIHPDIIQNVQFNFE